jgi:hypothetical protein
MMNENSLVDGDTDWRHASWNDWDCHLDDVRAIIAIYNEIQKCCRHLLADELTPCWEPVSSFEHRALYLVRRILFCAWYHNNFQNQADLPIGSKPKLNLSEARWSWYHWLKQEIQSWFWEPSLLRKMTQLMQYPNQLKGYIAENELTLQLMERFDDIPWKKSFMNSVKAELDRDIQNLTSQNAT